MSKRGAEGWFEAASRRTFKNERAMGMTFDDLAGVSDGHRRCMRAILAKVKELRTPFCGLPVVVGHENDDGSVTTIVTEETDARARSALRPDMMQALEVGFRKASKLEAPVVVLAIDAAGMCVVTCIEFGAAGEQRDEPSDDRFAHSRGVDLFGTMTAERLWAAIEEGVASDPTGPMAHAARRLHAMEQNEGGGERRDRILRSIDTLMRHLMANPEIADAIRRNDVRRVAQALAELAQTLPLAK